MEALRLKKELLSVPGDTIQEHIDFIGMSQAELAERIGRSVPKLNELIKGKSSITRDTAQKLEFVLGVPASFWLNLEKQYQEELLEIEKLEELSQSIEWVKGFPLEYLKSLGLLPDSKDKITMKEALLKFFRVASENEWHTIYSAEVSLSYKIDLRHSTEPKVIATWLRLGELDAEKINVSNFDKKVLSESITRLQTLMYEHPDDWLIQLQEICASFGVALVYSQCLSKAPIYGAARWIRNKTLPLIQITDRQKDYNAFWFSFFHELAHIKLHNKSEVFIDGKSIDFDSNLLKEKEADSFAAKILIGDSIRKLMKCTEKWDKNTLLLFSAKHKVHPSILVSQLQREKRIGYHEIQFNDLKSKVVFSCTNQRDHMFEEVE